MSSSNQSKPYTLSFFTAKDPSPGQPFLLRSLKSTIFKKRREKTMSIESLSLFPGILLHFDWIFHTNHATLLQEVRSGANAAEIYSLAFSSTAQYSALRLILASPSRKSHKVQPIQMLPLPHLALLAPSLN
ncbi:hypothetical protein GLYMA_20G050150v4 [Glycine max]|nr:hypothetical protein GLYMA_20G050150v4 [Glycine max]KAG4394501.1 hypothetical protein GLYMA_20G050150v4 [Glycine max]KAH1034593.1 hypothetical protein GYH30_054836 [Glycine max]KAH1034594.1 hypothetical protein GYH30_054836 [Glycine max]